MTDLTLTRWGSTPHGTFGAMDVDGLTLYTVERPWLDNRRNISCIPAGKYPLRSRKYYRGGYDAIEVTEVPGRSLILFHRGNTMSNSQGCILPGMDLGYLNPGGIHEGGLWAVMQSAAAFAHLMGAWQAHAYEHLIVEWQDHE